MLWCSLSVFIGLSAISQGGVTRFIPGILVSTTILFYLIVIRANSVTYSSLKQFNTKTGVLSIASSAGTLCCVADTIYHMVMKSGAISKLMSKDISTTTIQAVVVIALLTMSFIAMYGVSVIFNYMLKYLLKEMRVHHYVKNFLVYAALACSGKFFDAEKLMPATLIFVAFCFTSSIVYMINDIKDVEKDRNHPTKCKRPIAAGNISIRLAIFVCVVLFVVATVCCIASRSLMASFLLFLYLCLNVAYSMGLKNVPILDVSILVSGFLLRLICGAVAADIVVSNWLYLTVISLAFYLALGKRRNELKKTAGNTRSVLKKYPESFYHKNLLNF